MTELPTFTGMLPTFISYLNLITVYVIDFLGSSGNYVNKINNSFHFFNRVILTFCNKLNALSVAKSQKTTKLLNAAAICYNHIK